MHKAVLDKDKDVAIKIVKPDIKKTIQKDIKALRTLAKILCLHSFVAKFNLEHVVDEYASWIKDELNMLEEEKHMRAIKENLSDVKVIIPENYPELTTEHTLVMSFESGTPMAKYAFKRKEDAKKFALRAITSATTMIFKDGYFHADPHGGNIYVGENETPLYFDFGMCGKVSSEMKLQYLNVFALLFKRQTENALREFCMLTENKDGNFDSFLKKATPIVEEWYGKSIKSFSLTTMIRKVMYVAAKEGYIFNPNIVLLVKTLYNLEGMTLQIYPDFSYEEVVKKEVIRLARKEYSYTNLSKEIIGLLTPQNLYRVKDVLFKGIDLLENRLNGKPTINITKNYGKLILFATFCVACLYFLVTQEYILSGVAFLIILFLYKFL